jgi:Kef-type K+ transport system membrane component KefB
MYCNNNIVGAFIVGIIVPREGELNIALTEKLEDMVSIVFLPLVSHIEFHAASHTA